MLAQRLGSATQMDEKFISEFLRIVTAHPGSCDEVWLATSYGFPSLETHKKMAEQLAVTAGKMREAGIRVSLQISNTIGHGQYMAARDCSGLVYDGSPVEKLVGDDGTVAQYCFCWRGKHFRDYVREEVRAYAAAIKPHTVWIDDDLRAVNHAPVRYGCFCDSCIRTFNEKYGGSFTRETLVREVNHGDVAWREKYIDFVREGLYDLTYDIYSTIHAVSPETRGGLQNGPNGYYTGNGYPFIFAAMRDATGKNPAYRPGAGAYNDHNPNEQLYKTDCLAWQNHTLPDYVTEIRPEIENLPDVRFGKSIAGTCYETTLYMANGANAMSYAMLMNDYEDMDWHGEMLAAFAAHRPYWKRLCAASTGTVAGGLQLVVGDTAWKRKIDDNAPDWSWTGEPYAEAFSALHATAIPVTYDRTKNPVYMLYAGQIPSLTDAEIENLLDKPVFTDGAALKMLYDRGFGAAFGAEPVPLSVAQLYERYTDHTVNAGFAGRTWSQSFFFVNGHALRDKDGTTEALSFYGTNSLNAEKTFADDREPYGMANGIVHTAKGAKWAVFGVNPFNSVISTEKRTQLLRAVDYISDNRLPAVLETPVQAMLFPREDAEGRAVSVSVLNATIGESGVLRLRVRRPAAEKGTVKAVFCAQYRAEQVLPLTWDGDDVLVTMPSLAPWSLGTVFFR